MAEGEGGEIQRVKGFSDGEFACTRCGRVMQFWWNGGELDVKYCCGLVYRTEHQLTDLVIYEDPAPDEIGDGP
jgi:hypothetical protein